jgi:glycosyltransferase-like protein
MLTYSVRPRGGVVHALELSRALAERGHDPHLVALAPPGVELFRPSAVPVHLIRHRAEEPGIDGRVLGMLAAYRDGLARLVAERGFDVVHAQDCLSANAALELRAAGAIDRVVRTVHHVDEFRSPVLVECQKRSIHGPDLVLCVSPPWVARLWQEFGVEAGLVTNGVDPRRFGPPRDPAERARLRASAGLVGRLVVLAVGGIEPRKGSLTLVEAFARLSASCPARRPLLVVAGGATLFDYRDEAERFDARAAELGVAGDVRTLGPVGDAELLRLYRAADVFAFPSTAEGFGLAALEALAAGLPVVATDLAAFGGFLRHERSALLVPVGDARALAAALERVAGDPDLADRLRAEGLRLARAHGWDRAARAHERIYLEFARAAAAVG